MIFADVPLAADFISYKLYVYLVIVREFKTFNFLPFDFLKIEFKYSFYIPKQQCIDYAA